MATVWHYNLGDRVCREVDVYDSDSPMRFGTVTRRYSEWSSLGYWYPELYEVEWDSNYFLYGKYESGKGYFVHGISLIPEHDYLFGAM